MKKQMKSMPAAQEDAEEEQIVPEAGAAQSPLLVYKTQRACQMLIQTILRERAENKRKDEEISRMRAAHAEELSLMRAENLALRKAVATYLNETSVPAKRKSAPDSASIPDALRTPEARALMQKLSDGRILDEHWQPLNLSNAEKGIVAQYLSRQLDIKNQWQSFAALWGMNPETLRRAAAKAMEQKKTLLFQDRLKSIFS